MHKNIFLGYPLLPKQRSSHEYQKQLSYLFCIYLNKHTLSELEIKLLMNNVLGEREREKKNIMVPIDGNVRNSFYKEKLRYDYLSIDGHIRKSFDVGDSAGISANQTGRIAQKCHFLIFFALAKCLSSHLVEI